MPSPTINALVEATSKTNGFETEAPPPLKVARPVSEMVRTATPASWIMKSPVPVRLKLRLLFPAETEAKPESSNPVNWVEAAEKVQRPVMV